MKKKSSSIGECKGEGTTPQMLSPVVIKQKASRTPQSWERVNV